MASNPTRRCLEFMLLLPRLSAPAHFRVQSNWRMGLLSTDIALCDLRVRARVVAAVLILE